MTSKVRDTKWGKDPKPYLPCPISGQLTSSECHWLFAKNLGPGNYAHLGVLRGLGLWCQLWGLKGVTCKMYAVDLWEKTGPSWSHQGELDALVDHLKGANLLANVDICKGYTSEWAKKLENEQFIFVFIDADHYYKSAKEDWEMWSKLVVPGGEVAFHDTHIGDVPIVVSEIDLTQWEEIEGMHTIRCFRKK